VVKNLRREAQSFLEIGLSKWCDRILSNLLFPVFRQQSIISDAEELFSGSHSRSSQEQGAHHSKRCWTCSRDGQLRPHFHAGLA
jgi:hypothetical protein